MTFRIKPEYDRKGRVSVSAGSGATIIRPPTDKELGFSPLFFRPRFFMIEH